MTLLPVHIIAGLVAITAGAVALFTFKGARLHRESGTIFVYTMVVMSMTGGTIALVKPNVSTALGGVLTPYMVATGMLTMRRRVVAFRGIDLALMLVVLTTALIYLTFGLEAVSSATRRKDGYPPPLFFTFGAIALLAAVGDVRMMLAGGLQGSRRLVRHLWRLCFAMFIATGSFFLGQAKVFPKSIRIFPVLAALAVLPLVVMLYWLVRIQLIQRFRRWRDESFEPTPLRRPALRLRSGRA